MSTLALVSTRKGLFQVTNDKTCEAVEFLGIPVSIALATKGSDTWFAALDHGHFGVKLHRSDDAGRTWQEVTAPSYPKKDDPEKGDTLELIWSLAFAGPDGDRALWAGTIPGGLFYSGDRGDSWELNAALWRHKERGQWFGGGFEHAGIHSICIHPDDHTYIKVGVSCAGVWVTRNHGESWDNKSQGMRAEYMPPDKEFDPEIQDPHRLVQCPSNPRSLWVQHHNGIFRSTDDSESWQEIKDVHPSTFGFAVAVHPNDGDTAWFVPGVKDECRIPVDGRFVVTRTRDGGRSFETLTKGLPQEPSYDLVYRHGLDIDGSGDRLIMGSTTGSLWLSEDQGDSWQCLSNHLPPIYAVSFLG